LQKGRSSAGGAAWRRSRAAAAPARQAGDGRKKAPSRKRKAPVSRTRAGCAGRRRGRARAGCGALRRGGRDSFRSECGPAGAHPYGRDAMVLPHGAGSFRKSGARRGAAGFAARGREGRGLTARSRRESSRGARTSGAAGISAGLTSVRRSDRYRIHGALDLASAARKFTKLGRGAGQRPSGLMNGAGRTGGRGRGGAGTRESHELCGAHKTSARA